MPRFAALKLDYEQLKSSYGNLLTVYEQLKNGSASEVSELLMRMRSEDALPGLPENDRTLRQSMDGPQPAEYDTGPVDNHDLSLAGFDAVLAREIPSRPDSARVVGVTSAQTGAIDSVSTSELGKRQRMQPPPFAPFRNSGYGYLQAYGSLERNSQSHISVSHKVLL